MCQEGGNLPLSIAHLVMILGELGRSDAHQRYFIFFAIDLSSEGHENGMTWGHRYKKIGDIDTYGISVLHIASFKKFGSLMCLWQALWLWKM